MFDDEFPKDTVRDNELFLTISQFHKLLAINKHPYNKVTIYRWLKVSKQFLPRPIQDFLEPAPATWFICMPCMHAKRPDMPMMPLRYLAEFTHGTATAMAVSNTGQPHIITHLHALKAQLDLVQQQITTLIGYYSEHEGKDTSHAQHRTGIHSTPAHASRR